PSDGALVPRGREETRQARRDRRARAQALRDPLRDVARRELLQSKERRRGVCHDDPVTLCCLTVERSVPSYRCPERVITRGRVWRFGSSPNRPRTTDCDAFDGFQPMWLRPRILDCDSAQLLHVNAHSLQQPFDTRRPPKARTAELCRRKILTGGPLHTPDPGPGPDPDPGPGPDRDGDGDGDADRDRDRARDPGREAGEGPLRPLAACASEAPRVRPLANPPCARLSLAPERSRHETPLYPLDPPVRPRRAARRGVRPEGPVRRRPAG